MLEPFIILATLFIAALFYFQLADRYNIIDKPNERSSHTQVTIRGGGILFPLAWMMYSISYGFVYPYVTVGVVLMAVISFLDDRISLSSRIRLLVHLVAFTACFWDLGLFQHLAWWQLAIVYIVSIGCVNAINFMDGINGITGLYSLAILVPLQIYFYGLGMESSVFMYLILSVLVFGFFNFRKKAKCFAGDVGSISMGYILIFFILGLMFQVWDSKLLPSSVAFSSFDFKYILLLALYGVDAIFTIIQRLLNKENIFKPHRKHLYQYLVNEVGMSHLFVSAIYAGIQLLINLALLLGYLNGVYGMLLLVLLCIVYILLKRYIIKRYFS